MLGITATPGQISSEEIEYASLDAQTGLFEYGTLAFPSGSPTLNRDSTRCEGCHGRPARPIWGEYPRWPGVYGSEDADVPVDQRQGFKGFLAEAATNPRYQNLAFETSSEADHFALKRRLYPFPNTDFSMSLGNVVALGVYQRIRSHSAYANLKWLPTIFSWRIKCHEIESMNDSLYRALSYLYDQALKTDPDFHQRYGDGGALDYKVIAYRLLGIDLGPDLSLSQPASQATFFDERLWSAGQGTLDDLMVVQNMVQLSQDDDELRTVLAPALPFAEQTVAQMELAGDARGKAVSSESEGNDWYPVPQVFAALRSDSVRQNLCTQLIAKIRH